MSISIEKLSEYLNLTPYQTYMVEKNSHKYDLDRLVKRGTVLYAPYKCKLAHGFRDHIEKLIWGPRADLIGADRLLVQDKRGIRVFASGFYRSEDSFGHKYYADFSGHRIRRKRFFEIV